MLTYLYSTSEKACSNEAVDLEGRLTRQGRQPLLITSRHLGKLQLMDISALTAHEAIIVDEAHLLSRPQADFLRFLSRRHSLEIICCGLREDKEGEPFEGSSLLLSWADKIAPIADNSLPEADEAEEIAISPVISDFLEAKGPAQRLAVFRDNKHRMDESMLDTIAAVLDIELRDEGFDEKARDIQNCLETIVKYEIERR